MPHGVPASLFCQAPPEASERTDAPGALQPPRFAPAPQGPVLTPYLSGLRQARSNGSRQAWGAMSWWIDFGPQEPGS